ncbi:MAG: putative toxin-antitoxin system toxin component, PIN family [Candidatus Electrothrix sp.]
MVPKIVIDTNIIVSALISSKGSYSRKIVEKVFKNEVTPLMGEALFNEHIEVASRRKIFKSCVLTVGERQEFLEAYMKCCRWCKIYYNWRPNLQDEGDNHIIELAVGGGASCIVTKNIKDLKSGELLFDTLRIVTPDEFIEEAVWERLR